MANQQVNVFRATVHLKSGLANGHRRGEEVLAIALTAQGAVAVIQAVYGSDLQSINGPTLSCSGVWTTLTGTPAVMGQGPAEETHHNVRKEEPAEEEPAHHKRKAA
jgi:hypothetical protein